MGEKFHERFDIPVSLDEAKRRFVNRAETLIFSGFIHQRVSMRIREDIKREIVAGLGEIYVSQTPLQSYISNDFNQTLKALEEFYYAVSVSTPMIYAAEAHLSMQLDNLIKRLLRDAEVDLGVRWENGCFVKSGAELLDKALVNDVLQWLRDKAYENVLMPYEKGLRHFLEAEKRPEVLSDVITDTYEAVEALAKIVTGRPNTDLSGNAEVFIKAVKASDEYKSILKEYIVYANRFRHSPRPDRPRPSLSVPEVESFIYLTGIFIRLAITGTDKYTTNG